MSQSTVDLAKLFGVAMDAVGNNREALNSMDDTNHPNHGDNVTHNLGLIQSALASQQSQNPSDALRLAAQQLSQQGRVAPLHNTRKDFSKQLPIFKDSRA